MKTPQKTIFSTFILAMCIDADLAATKSSHFYENRFIMTVDHILVLLVVVFVLLNMATWKGAYHFINALV